MLRAMVALALVVAAPVTAQQTGSDEAAVRAAFDTIQSAVERQDIAALEGLIHPAFEMHHGLGQSDTRPTWFALVSSGRLPRQTSDRREFDQSITVVGDTALIRSLVRLRDTRGARDVWMRSTAVLVRHNVRWLQLNQQSSLLHEGPSVDLKDGAAYGGFYEIEGRDGFMVNPMDGYLQIEWKNGAKLPLLPADESRFGAGPGSTVIFTRDAAGQVNGATRTGSDGRLWWTSTRKLKP